VYCWSVGLVQREIEAAGFSTISLSMMPDLTVNAGAPGIAAIEHPFGVTLGRSGNAAVQLAVLRAALGAMEAWAKPGGAMHLPFEWGASAVRLECQPSPRYRSIYMRPPSRRHPMPVGHSSLSIFL
jgi:hypothetical protein